MRINIIFIFFIKFPLFFLKVKTHLIKILNTYKKLLLNLKISSSIFFNSTQMKLRNINLIFIYL